MNRLYIAVLIFLSADAGIEGHDGAEEAQLTGQVLVQGDMLMEPLQHHAAYNLNVDDPKSFAGAALESDKKRYSMTFVTNFSDAFRLVSFF